MEKTIFQKIIDREIESDILYETERILVLYDKEPIVKGHCLVVPKNPYKDFFESVDSSDANEIMKEITHLSNVLKEILDIDGINLISNAGSAAGQVIFHLHFHLIPRYANDDVKISLGGKLLNYKGEQPDKELIEKIKKEMNR